MRIVYDYPPNYELICKKLKAVRGVEGIIFTYGNTIYVPAGRRPTMDFIAHEEVHAKQQLVDWEGDVDGWWNKYLSDKQFRLSQELEAYRRQFQFVEGYGFRFQYDLLEKIARDLGSAQYGNIIKPQEAAKLIMKGTRYEQKRKANV